MSPYAWMLIAGSVAGWVALWMWAIPTATRRLRTTLEARLDESAALGGLDLLNSWYTRWFHRLRFEGFEDLPSPFRPGDHGGGIVVANHASGVDPILVQAGLRRFVRWMMWADMMAAPLAEVWRVAQVLPVRFGAEDATIVRRAVRWVKEGNLLGIFPEGSIARPAGEIRPFQPGVGLVARLARCPVLLLHIDGAPDAPTAFGAIVRRSRATVRVVGIFDLSGEKDPAVATALLRDAMVEFSGWPRNDESLIDLWLQEVQAAATA